LDKRQNLGVTTIRQAEPNDADGIARVHVGAWKVAYKDLLPDEFLGRLRPDEWAPRYHFGYAEQGTPSTIVAIERDEIAGFSTIGPSRDADDQEAGEIYAIYVDPTRWGVGVGHLLLAESRQQLARRGHSEALLWVLLGNEQAQRFYVADGWILDGGQREENVWGVVANVIRMRRPVP
jgi:ribosomal protein S18 acetylase RimI-like enzyme